MAANERETKAQDREHIVRLLDAGRAWNLAPVLAEGGALIFGDCEIELCGAQAAAVVQACLASGKRRVVAIGPLRPVSPNLAAMLRRVEAGESALSQAGWGIQGPVFPCGPDWREERSLDAFQLLWDCAVKDDPAGAPELIVCYPFLANGTPSIMPGMAHLRELASDAAVVAAMSPFCGPSAKNISAAAGRTIAEGMKLLAAGDYAGYQRHSAGVGSDGADVGQVLRYLIGPFQARIEDMVRVDLPNARYQAGALIALTPAAPAEETEPAG